MVAETPSTRAGRDATASASAGDVTSKSGVYPQVLGDAWYALDPAVRRAHADGRRLRGVGHFRVEHGRGALTRLLVRAAGVPPPHEAAPVRILIERIGGRERWRRSIGGRPLVTEQYQGSNGTLVERFGPLKFSFQLIVDGGSLIYRQVTLALALGRLQIPVPARLQLHIDACEESLLSSIDSHTTVEVSTASGRLLFSYRGAIRWDTGT